MVLGSISIEDLLEGFFADSFVGFEEGFVLIFSDLDVGIDDGFDGGGNVFVGESGANDAADLGILVWIAPEEELIDFFSAFVEAEDADMSDMVMSASVDAS